MLPLSAICPRQEAIHAGEPPSEPSATNNVHNNNIDSVMQHASSVDDLPQYVYALAYHVITFWFLAVKIPERPNHIGWTREEPLYRCGRKR